MLGLTGLCYTGTKIHKGNKCRRVCHILQMVGFSLKSHYLSLNGHVVFAERIGFQLTLPDKVEPVVYLGYHRLVPKPVSEE